MTAIAEVLVIGDSVLAALAQPPGEHDLPKLGRRYTYVLDAADCRGLMAGGGSNQPSPLPSSVSTVLEQRAGEYGRALVIGVGYDITPREADDLGEAVDRVIEAARRESISTVVWLTCREAGTSAQVTGHRRDNEVLRRKAIEHRGHLHLANWAERSKPMPPSWFADDELHLGPEAARAMADLVAEVLDGALEPSTPEPSTPVPATWLPVSGAKPPRQPAPPKRRRRKRSALQVGEPPIDPSHLTVLVPARNAAHQLPAWLDSVASYADSVIALDDGSTDGTRAILEEHPLVAQVLTNPVRATYHGWDDLGNRQRLVDAALRRGARWILFLDADETIDQSDARALCDFLDTDARPGYAYGFEEFRMVDDDDHHDPRGMWIFRLFSALDALDPLGSKRLHFIPVPSGIERGKWLLTSLRVRHTGSLTPSHRRARFAKYEEADPHNEFQDDYTNLLADSAYVVPWSRRSDQLPVLLGKNGRYADQLVGAETPPGPVITAVVIAQNDRAVIARSVQALVDQELDDEFEIIVVCSGSDDTSSIVREKFASVRCVQLPAKALPGEARNAGLWMARGEYVSFPGSHVWVLPGSLAARLRVYDDGWDLVTGSVVNGNTTRAGWASYFLDHAAQVPSRPSGPFQGVPGHASYTTSDVLGVGGFPEDVRTAEDTVVNRRLFFAGKRTYFAADVSFAHASPSTNAAHLLRHHFQRGRGLGRIIASNDKSTRERLRASKSLAARRMRFIRKALEHADAPTRQQYRRVRFLVMAGALASATGTWFQLITNRPATPMSAEPSAPREFRSGAAGPLLVLSGRHGEAAHGLLSYGPTVNGIERLRTFTRYAQNVCDVRPALAPIVTSATFTAEREGTYTIDLPTEMVDTYHAATRDAGVLLLLQIQPGRAPIEAVLERWADFLREPDVGIFLDLRDQVAFAGQRNELANVVQKVREIGGDDTIILVRGAVDLPPGTIDGSHVIELRQPDALYPHDELAVNPHSPAYIYH